MTLEEFETELKALLRKAKAAGLDIDQVCELAEDQVCELAEYLLSDSWDEY